jgi:hypothetical protein
VRRRAFLLAGAATVSGLAAWQIHNMSFEDGVKMIVRKRLDYLRHDAASLRLFARDIKDAHVISRERMYLLLSIKPAYAHLSLSSGQNRLAFLLRHGEDKIVSTYLISSDFFLNGADEARVVRYLGRLDPLRACGNPFARPLT